MAKRELDKYKGVSAVACTSLSAKIHGMLTSVSPMKKRQTCSFFNGKITDGKSCTRAAPIINLPI